MEQDLTQRGHLALTPNPSFKTLTKNKSSSAAAPDVAAATLPGDFVVWLLVLLEMTTFAILFIGFAGARLAQPEVFAAGQAKLALWSGAVNTVLLVSASACAAWALHAVRTRRSRQGSYWLLGALALGIGFLVVKSIEYWHKWEMGLDFAGNTFDMLYVMLTGFHFLHALVGCVLFALVWAPTRHGRYTPENCHTLETVTVFWHMVDLLWMILFPLVYVLR